MKNGRYDTLVPYQYIVAVKDVAKDEEGGGALLKDPEVYKNFQSILSSYLSNDKCPIRPQFLHTLAAIMDFLAGRVDLARQHMEAIQYHASSAQEFAEFVNIPEMVKKLRASTP